MNNFIFQNPTKIIFGKDTEKLAGVETKNSADKILLHYGGGSIKKTGLYDTVVKSLKEAGVEFLELSGVQPNPRLSLVQKGIEICRGRHPPILAVGGEVHRLGKAIAAERSMKGMSGISPEKPKWGSPAVGVFLTIPAAANPVQLGYNQ